MHDAIESQLRHEASVPTASSLTGTLIDFDGAWCLVRDPLGVEQRWRWGGTVIPAPGDAVQVLVQDGVHVVTGRASPTPTQGTVTAVSSTVLEVAVLVGPSPIQAAFTYASPQPGDIVALSHGYEGFLATGKSSFTPTKQEVEVTRPTPKPSSETQTFRAKQAGTWHVGSWITSMVRVSDSNVAGFHYGSALGSTLPDDAVILSGQIYLPATQNRWAKAPRIQAFNGPAPSSGGVGDAVELPARKGWVDVPKSVLEQLRTGNRGLKLLRTAVSSEGTDDIYKTLNSDPMSGALRLTWREAD